MSAFYENYVKLCALHNLSESGAAKKIGLSNAAANGWKKGKMPSATTQVKLTDLFGVSVKELIGETDDPSAGIKKDPIPKDGAVSQEKQLPLDMIDGLSDEQKELLALSKKMSDDELKRFIAAMKAMLGESM